MSDKAQIRAARHMLGMTQVKLREAAGVPLDTLRRIEVKPDHKGLVSDVATGATRTALEAAGAVVISENGRGAGVRLLNRSSSPEGNG